MRQKTCFCLKGQDGRMEDRGSRKAGQVEKTSFSLPLSLSSPSPLLSLSSQHFACLFREGEKEGGMEKTGQGGARLSMLLPALLKTPFSNKENKHSCPYLLYPSLPLSHCTPRITSPLPFSHHPLLSLPPSISLTLTPLPPHLILYISFLQLSHGLVEDR